MTSDLDAQVTQILAREGSAFTADAQDTPTKYGITLASYRAWKPVATLIQLEALEEPEARAFYGWYFAPFVGLATSDRVWANLLDAVTLHGRVGAVKAIQRAIGLAADGVVGPATTAVLEALGAHPGGETVFLVAFTKERLRIMRNDIVADLTKKYGLAAVTETDLAYLGGWCNRVIDVAFG